MIIAKIAVAAAVYAIDKPYDYVVPKPLEEQCVPGVRVVVPFGRSNKRSEGVVLSLDSGLEDNLKSVETVLDDSPVLTETMIRLAGFIRERYFCTLYEAVRIMLPAGLWFKSIDTVSLTAKGLEADFETVFPKNQDAVAVGTYIREMGGRTDKSTMSRILGKEIVENGMKTLKTKKLILSEGSLVRNASDKTEKVAVLNVTAEEAAEVAARKQRAPMQKALLEMLSLVGSCAVKELCYYTGASSASVKALEKGELIRLEVREVFRKPMISKAESAEPIVLNPEQQKVFDQLSGYLQEEPGNVSLLYGITGSGKTAVYIRLIHKVLEQGKTAIVLVPEIALTPQLMELFSAHFGEQVAVLHSALQVGQRYDEWKRIRTGKASVVVGTRSAVFAPVQNPGIIIVDEEHETTYKSEMNPRYHAREIAIWRGSREKAMVLLGSATPSVDSMYLAQQGVYHYAELRQRFNAKNLPKVMLTNMRDELKNGNSTSISSLLREEIQKNLDAGQQTILFLNRRGTSRTVVCPTCGYVPHCRRCSVSLTYHAANDRLMCHYCGYSIPASSSCPKCGTTFRLVGTGTQRVQEELHNIWPWVETIRMDADTVTATNSHEHILNRFGQERIPILIGTQMVTKGLNFPNVTLVGVLDGDSSLYTDNFRASEMAFSRITQVIGRAGRGDTAGRAIIQTMTPDNEVLLQAAAQDYDAFYASELPLRELRDCPPYLDMIRLSFYGATEHAASDGAARFRAGLTQSLRTEEFLKHKIIIMGPTPATVIRVMNRYHFNVTILAKNTRGLRNVLANLLKWFKKDKLNKNITVTVDVNPLD